LIHRFSLWCVARKNYFPSPPRVLLSFEHQFRRKLVLLQRAE
jgi:hypothetical protein